jgi:hypothetical protein
MHYDKEVITTWGIMLDMTLTIHVMHHILNYMGSKISHLMKFRLYEYV